MELHPGIRIETFRIGVEQAPLLVIDQFAADPEILVNIARRSTFNQQSRYYPGIRAAAPPEYAQLFAGPLGDLIADVFGLSGGTLRFPLCHYSLVTTPADQLMVPQRIPHVDSLPSNGLASIHYLFKAPLGGTAFYRHRKTGFEFIDEARNERYLTALRAESQRSQVAGAGYINGSTALFEQIDRRDGVFNRMLIYRRNSLHSGCIDAAFRPDPDPATGRLSINCFFEFAS